jgi:hypothetical protein
MIPLRSEVTHDPLCNVLCLGLAHVVMVVDVIAVEVWPQREGRSVEVEARHTEFPHYFVRNGVVRVHIDCVSDMCVCVCVGGGVCVCLCCVCVPMPLLPLCDTTFKPAFIRTITASPPQASRDATLKSTPSSPRAPFDATLMRTITASPPQASHDTTLTCATVDLVSCESHRRPV